MAVRTAPTSEKLRNRWGQIGISACVLLLPPIAIGGTATAMLSPRHETAAQDASPAVKTIAVALAAEAVPAFKRDAAPAQAALPRPAAPQPAPGARNGAGPTAQQKDAAQTVDQQRGVMAASAPGGASAYTLASAGQEPPIQAIQSPQAPPPPQSGKDVARMMGPVPVRVTVVMAPNAGHADGTQPEPPAGDAPPPSATQAESPPAPPAMLAELPPAPPAPPTAFAADVPDKARTSRTSVIPLPPRRNVARDETRPARPAHATRQPPHPASPADVLRGWLEQLGGSHPRTAQRG